MNTMNQKPTRDILSRLAAADSVVYSAGLLTKIKSAARARRRVRCIYAPEITAAEVQELNEIHGQGENGWFTYRGIQIVISKRGNGQIVLFRF